MQSTGLVPITFIRALSNKRKRQQQQHECSTRKVRVSPNIRYIHFTPMLSKQKCIREGIIIDGAPDECRDTLTEAHLYHFVNTDSCITRQTQRTQKYIGVFCVRLENDDCVYVHPLDADWKHIYNGTRDDVSQAYDILDDGTPYWTDVYVAKKIKKKGHL